LDLPHLFVRQGEAPAAICALKNAILHRKNSLFYKTVYGAQVGDLYMSLIHTAELNRVAPSPCVRGIADPAW